MTAGPPPPGWLGKPHACAVGVDAAGPADDGVLAFVDADVRLFPDALAGAVAVLERHGLDLVSPWPRPLAHGPAERLVQPLVAVAVGDDAARSGSPSARPGRRSPRPPGSSWCSPGAATTGPGGHAAVRGEVLEDIALLRAVKRAGGRGGPVDGSRLAACRMYDGWPALRDGYAKSLWGAVGGSPVASSAAAAALTAVWVVPALAALRGSRAGLAGYAAGVAGRGVVAAATGSRLWPDALAHPVSVLAAGPARWRARCIGHRRGTLSWRGRAAARAASGDVRRRWGRDLPRLPRPRALRPRADGAGRLLPGAELRGGAPPDRLGLQPVGRRRRSTWRRTPSTRWPASTPPVVQFTSVGRKDSLRNVEATGEFTVSLTPEALFEQINATGTDFPPGTSEAEACGVRLEPSDGSASPGSPSRRWPSSARCTPPCASATARSCSAGCG